MRTLYTRIVLTFILVAMVSSIIALLVTNVYYTAQIREYNEDKIVRIAQEIRSLLEETPDTRMEALLPRIANMGFQIYAVDSGLRGTFYGAPFKHQAFDMDIARRVLAGETYRGLEEERHWLMVTGFFENSLRNTAGIPLQSGGQAYALFIRPNLEEQIGEVRILMGLLLGLTFLFSIGLIILLTRYIVKPLQLLTGATNKIVGGNYNIEIDMSRKDEIGNLARHFTHMAGSLKRLEQMRQEFVANVSHEIQSPLTSIQGFAQTMLQKETSPEEEAKYLKIIEEESRRLSSLSQQLLTLASLDKEETVLKLSSYRLDEQIRQAFLLLEWQWSEKELHIELDLPDVVIQADEQLLYQVWLNLLGNSIKFSRKGDSLRVAMTVEGRHIAVTVSDTGVGIPASEVPYVFDRFYKADKARNRTRSGSGLGLSIVKKIVELHNGTVEVSSSEPGKGTVVTVRLPFL
ncbi:sensor histidine kinase [Paenibacillus sp. H1-7]|uniref:sensor histidine kinase n=1 Tax=Paenibacillus sp. H1-7 TaxID=2282849 RepID=UPI001EF80449|nr:HAMP domain-containing sensor histidine kinase [Paenibacillus sp. H1-7]ULL18808.1 sensor histidine kinase [Paenibacillus sp. H1-7]